MSAGQTALSVDALAVSKEEPLQEIQIAIPRMLNDAAFVRCLRVTVAAEPQRLLA